MPIIVSVIAILVIFYVYPIVFPKKGNDDEDNQPAIVQVDSSFEKPSEAIPPPQTIQAMGHSTVSTASFGVATITPAPDKPNESVE